MTEELDYKASLDFVYRSLCAMTNQTYDGDLQNVFTALGYCSGKLATLQSLNATYEAENKQLRQALRKAAGSESGAQSLMQDIDAALNDLFSKGAT